MHVQTFSIVVGGTACNAKCPFCVSRMTGNADVPEIQSAEKLSSEIDWVRFNVAKNLAKRAHCTTAMLTGKGEPTLWPTLITEYLDKIRGDFPIVELQTNGLLVEHLNTFNKLSFWRDLGLTTVALSVVDVDQEKNRKIYLPHRQDYPSLAGRIEILHQAGLSVRLVCTMNKQGAHKADDLWKVISYAKENKVEQLTFTPVNAPQSSSDKKASKWTRENMLSETHISSIVAWFNECATPIMRLAHGAVVYDFEGQNVCLNNCLQKEETKLDQMRNLIWLNNHLYHRWDYPGSVLL